MSRKTQQTGTRSKDVDKLLVPARALLGTSLTKILDILSGYCTYDYKDEQETSKLLSLPIDTLNFTSQRFSPHRLSILNLLRSTCKKAHKILDPLVKMMASEALIKPTSCLWYALYQLLDMKADGTMEFHTVQRWHYEVLQLKWQLSRDAITKYVSLHCCTEDGRKPANTFLMCPEEILHKKEEVSESDIVIFDDHQIPSFTSPSSKVSKIDYKTGLHFLAFEPYSHDAKEILVVEIVRSTRQYVIECGAPANVIASNSKGCCHSAVSVLFQEVYSRTPFRSSGSLSQEMCDQIVEEVSKKCMLSAMTHDEIRIEIATILSAEFLSEVV